MILRSHVSLLILCDAEGVGNITLHLEKSPDRVEDNVAELGPDVAFTHTWILDSPLSHAEANPTGRLKALVDVIEPYREKLLTLDPKYPLSVDIVYHITPQHAHGITGEFDWFSLPASLIKRLAALDLKVSYESFWFDHPEWKRPRLPWWRRLLGDSSL